MYRWPLTDCMLSKFFLLPLAISSRDPLISHVTPIIIDHRVFQTPTRVQLNSQSLFVASPVHTPPRWRISKGTFRSSRLPRTSSRKMRRRVPQDTTPTKHPHHATAGRGPSRPDPHSIDSLITFNCPIFTQTVECCAQQVFVIDLEGREQPDYALKEWAESW